MLIREVLGDVYNEYNEQRVTCPPLCVLQCWPLTLYLYCIIVFGYTIHSPPVLATQWTHMYLYFVWHTILSPPLLTIQWTPTVFHIVLLYFVYHTMQPSPKHTVFALYNCIWYDTQYKVLNYCSDRSELPTVHLWHLRLQDSTTIIVLLLKVQPLVFRCFSARYILFN